MHPAQIRVHIAQNLRMISGFAGDVFRGEHPEKLTTYFDGAPTSYYDLWRVENGKIAEHWDVMETIADQSTWQNQNGKF